MNVQELALVPSPEVAAALAAVEDRGERIVTEHEGARTVWRRWGTGSPVLLLHGGSGSWKHWIRNVPALARTHTVIAPDLPCMGESDLPPGTPSFEVVAEQLARGLGELLPDGPFIDAAGFSLGTSMAVQLAHARPGLVRNLVLLGGNFVGRLERSEALRSLRGVPDVAGRLAVYRHNLRVMMIGHDEHLDELATFIYALDASRRRVPAKAFRGRDVVRRLLPTAQLQGTVSGLSGREDWLVGEFAAQQREALAHLRPGSRYDEIAGAGHWVMYEASHEVNARLEAAFA